MEQIPHDVEQGVPHGQDHADVSDKASASAPLLQQENTITTHSGQLPQQIFSNGTSNGAANDDSNDPAQQNPELANDPGDTSGTRHVNVQEAVATSATSVTSPTPATPMADSGQDSLSVQQTIAEPKERTTKRPLARLVFSVLVHVLGLLLNIGALVIFGFAKQWEFFICLTVLWLINGFLCASIAYQQKILKGTNCIVRFPVLLIVYGLFQWIQVRRMYDGYKERKAGARGRTLLRDGCAIGHSSPSRDLFHSKTFDSVIVAFPFAVMSIYGFFMLDGSHIECSYYEMNLKLRYAPAAILAGSGVFSIGSVALGMLEVDYRVSGRVSSRVEEANFKTVHHFLYRGAEAAFRIFLLVILCMVMRAWLSDAGFSRSYSFFVLGPAGISCVLNLMIICSAGSGEQFIANPLAHIFIAVCAVVVDPFVFVDDARHQSAARKASTYLRVGRVLEFVASALLVWNLRGQRFGPECRMTHTVGEYLATWRKSVFICLGIAFLVHVATWLLLRNAIPFIEAQWSHASTLLPLIPYAENPAMHRERVRMETANATQSLSAFLLQVGTGISSHIFGSHLSVAHDFQLERVLGAGNYGVVVKVRQSSAQGVQLPPVDYRWYALKFSDRAQDEHRSSTNREISALSSIRRHHHPFAMRLAHWFDVPPDMTFQCENGQSVEFTAGHKVYRNFKTAIMMEFCDGGDLQSYIDSKSGGEPGTAFRMRTMRTFGAELADVMCFLHAQEPPIVFRDLKPDNILLKKGLDYELHVCLTDFGFSKQPTLDDELYSFAGNGLTVSPEVAGYYIEHGGHAGRKKFTYTAHVDVYAFGVTFLVMLGCTMPDARRCKAKFKDNQVPNWTSAPFNSFIPPDVVGLLNRAMKTTPVDRGTMREVADDHFFTQEIHHKGESFGPIDMDKQRSAAQWVIRPPSQLAQPSLS